jgi:hypothetical protein
VRSCLEKDYYVTIVQARITESNAFLFKRSRTFISMQKHSMI